MSKKSGGTPRLTPSDHYFNAAPGAACVITQCADNQEDSSKRTESLDYRGSRRTEAADHIGIIESVEESSP